MVLGAFPQDFLVNFMGLFEVFLRPPPPPGSATGRVKYLSCPIMITSLRAWRGERGEGSDVSQTSVYAGLIDLLGRQITPMFIHGPPCLCWSYWQGLGTRIPIRRQGGTLRSEDVIEMLLTGVWFMETLQVLIDCPRIHLTGKGEGD